MTEICSRLGSRPVRKISEKYKVEISAKVFRTLYQMPSTLKILPWKQYRLLADSPLLFAENRSKIKSIVQ
jgi:hypothetical protein